MVNRLATLVKLPANRLAIRNSSFTCAIAPHE